MQSAPTVERLTESVCIFMDGHAKATVVVDCIDPQRLGCRFSENRTVYKLLADAIRPTTVAQVVTIDVPALARSFSTTATGTGTVPTVAA
jgi:hypothetical protein